MTVALPENPKSDTVTAGDAATVDCRIRRKAHEQESCTGVTFQECCQFCGATDGPLIEGWCEDCARDVCRDELELYVGAICWCSHHRRG